MARLANGRYSAFDMETFHGLERFRDALDNYKESNPNKTDCGDLRQNPDVLSEIYSKAFGVENKLSGLEGKEKSEYQDKLTQEAGNAYALNKPENYRDAFADFSYDSFHSSKNVEMVFMGTEQMDLNTIQYFASVKLNNSMMPIKDAELGRGQKNGTLYSTTDMYFGDDVKKIKAIHDAKPSDYNHYDDSQGCTETSAAFKADVIPIIRSSDDGKTINLVGFAPDMSTLKKTDCTYSVLEIWKKNQNVSEVLYKNANSLERDGSHKNDMGLRAVQEGRDILNKMATMPLNAKAMPDMYKAYNKKEEAKQWAYAACKSFGEADKNIHGDLGVKSDMKKNDRALCRKTYTRYTLTFAYR